MRIGGAVGYSEILQLVIVCGFAWWKGSPPERAGSLVIAAVWVMSNLCCRLIFHPGHYDSFRTTLTLAGDILAAVGFLAIAIRYSSLWLGAVLLVQGAQMTLHAVFLGDEPASLLIYIVMTNLFSALVLLMLMAGTAASWWSRARKERRVRQRVSVVDVGRGVAFSVA